MNQGLIAQHDFERKMKNTVTYLERGDKVKVRAASSICRVVYKCVACVQVCETIAYGVLANHLSSSSSRAVAGHLKSHCCSPPC